MIQDINLGSAPNDKTGDKARVAGQKINANFAYLEAKIDNKSYIKVETGFTLVAQDLTFNADWEWMINNIDYTNPSSVVINIPFAASGKSRIDLIVCNSSNTFNRVAGIESVSTPVAPPLPVNTVLATFFTISDGSVGIPEPPVLGANYIEKREQQPFQVWNSGEINNTVLDDFFYGYLNFRDAVTNLKSIGTYTNAYLYSGRELLIKNSQTTDITIYHLTGSGFQFSFPNEVNFILKPNEIIRFSTKILSPTSGILEYVGVVLTKADIGLSNVENTSDLNKPVSTAQQAALDLKLNTADYNQHFKGIYLTEAALNAAHPTGVAGDSAQVNEAGATDVVNYSWDAEENIWVAGGGTGGAANTDALPEGSSNLYFTTARVLATLLTGISFATGGAIVSTDSVLVAFGKLQKQITDILTAIGLKQDALVSGANIKTVNGISLLGSGDFAINAGLPFNTTAITTATYTFDLSDSNTIRIFSYNATTVITTIPTDAVTNFAIGTRIGGYFIGAVQLAISGAGVTIRNNSNTYPNNFFYIVKIGANVWSVESIDKTSPLFNGSVRGAGFAVNANGQGYEFSGASIVANNGNMVFNTYGNSSGATALYRLTAVYPHSQSPNASTGITSMILDLSHTHSANGGNVNAKTLNFTPTINQIGGATGTIWSIYINPTLTAAYDYRAIEIVKGSVHFPYATASGTYAIKNSDYLLDFTTGTFTATLPTAVGCAGRNYVLKNSGSGVITVDTTSSQTIDGATTYSLAVQYATITIVSNGANWIIIAKI